MSEQKIATKITATIDIEYSPQIYIAKVYENDKEIATCRGADFHLIAEFLIAWKVQDLIWLKE